MKKLTRNFYTGSTLDVAKELLGKYIVRKIGNPEGTRRSGSYRAGKKLIGKIIETEAYIGPQDRASHAFLPRRNFRIPPKKNIKKIFGSKLSQNKVFLENFLRGGGKVTARNKAEYLRGGHIYIYLVYGMYWQMNVSTAKEGEPECVLIRALEPVLDNSKLGIDSKATLRGVRFASSKIKNLKLANGPGKLCRYLKLDKSFYGEDITKSKRIWLEDRGEKIKPSQILATKRIGIDYAGSYWSRRKWRFLIKDFEKYLAK